MNRAIPFYMIGIVMLTAILMSSCKGKSEVALANDSIVEESSFKKSNGEMCKIKTTVYVSYPSEYKDQETLEKLQALFNSSILRAPSGETSIKSALSSFAKTLMFQNDSSDTASQAGIDETCFDPVDVDNFEIVVKISNVYNQNQLLSFCIEEVIKKNEQNSSVSHRYVNLDVEKMKRVGVNDLFTGDNLNKITQMLKSKLMEDQDAHNEDELNQMGYFNLPNLSVTNNFFFTDEGVTWSYEPNDIAVASVGEPTILLRFEDLMQFSGDESLLNRF